MPDLPSIPGYDVEAEIGRGGMGVVYRVRRQATGETLALKMVLCGRGASFQELARFRVEAEALACLDHPNIVRVHEVGVFAGCPFFTMDFATRGTLGQLTRQSALPAVAAAEVVTTLALAVQHAHGRGMLHRDLKPANVLVMDDGNLKVTDFGLVKFAARRSMVSDACCLGPERFSDLDRELARLAAELASQYRPATGFQAMSREAAGEEESLARSVWRECVARTGLPEAPSTVASVAGFLRSAREQSRAGQADQPDLDGLTRPGAVMGSPQYMSPEQAAGDLSRIGRQTDVYALGAIFYELLTGRPPVRGATLDEVLREVVSRPATPPRQIEPAVPPELEAACLRCLEKEPRRRYPTAAALADDLRKFTAGGAPTGMGEGSPSGDQAGEAATRSEGQAGQGSTRSWWPFRRRPG
jgi:serine/threonine protein kinase